MKTSSYRDLIVWQKSYRLVLEIYRITSLFPRSEIFGLSQQIKKSAVSIPSNISEGYGRFHKNDYKHFLIIAKGSLYELQTQYSLACDLNFVQRNEVVESLMNEVGGMLYRMIHPKN